MNRVFIIGACRTPIGKMGGILSNFSAVELGTISVLESMKRAQIPPEQVDHIIFGCSIQAGLGQNPARQVALFSGLPVRVTAETLNIVCGSGLDSVISAARMIQCGDADIVIAGGMESMSQAPFLLKKARFGYRLGNGELIDSLIKDSLTDVFNNYHMGITAENLVKKYGLTRIELDKFAYDSQIKAKAAIEGGRFYDEIAPVNLSDKSGQAHTCSSDESPRFDSTLEKLSKLKPAFTFDGAVTAGNSSGINDGAASVVLISESKMKELSLKPMAEYIGGCLAGVNPDVMGLGPVESTHKLFHKLNISMNDIDLVEENEAFAAQAIAVARELRIPNEKLNVNGGAIALGHPVGASGCRILVTLLFEMIKRNAEKGLAMLCIGGGMGCSVVVQRSTEW